MTTLIKNNRFRQAHPFASRYYKIRARYKANGVSLPAQWRTVTDFELWAKDVVQIGANDILMSPNDELVSPNNFTYRTSSARARRSGGAVKERQVKMERYRFDAEGWKKQVREALDAKPNGLDPESAKKNAAWREAIREALHTVEED